jgi:hypothetical protein
MSAGISGVNWMSTFSMDGLGVQLVVEDPYRELNTRRFEQALLRRVDMDKRSGSR